MGAAKMISKGILCGIGGGLQGAGKGSRTIDINDVNTDHAEDFSDLAYQVGNQGMDKMKEKMSSVMGQQAANESAVSDVLLKTVYGDSLDDKIIDNFAKISAISFEYNDEAKSKYGQEKAVDDNQHIGVIAQELESNPVTEGAVKTNENGDLEVDTRHLTFADTAAIGELSRRVLALEDAVKELQQK